VGRVNPGARVVSCALVMDIDDPGSLRGARVLAIDDGPTLTHGGMPAGAAELMARRLGAILVDPRPHARGSLRQVYERHPQLGAVLPAMGYGPEQMADLAATVEAVPCDLIVAGTPIDLRRSLATSRPVRRLRYEARELGSPGFELVSPATRGGRSR
jgi:predicted GTPase